MLKWILGNEWIFWWGYNSVKIMKNVFFVYKWYVVYKLFISVIVNYNISRIGVNELFEMCWMLGIVYFDWLFW